MYYYKRLKFRGGTSRCCGAKVVLLGVQVWRICIPNRKICNKLGFIFGVATKWRTDVVGGLVIISQTVVANFILDVGIPKVHSGR